MFTVFGIWDNSYFITDKKLYILLGNYKSNKVKGFMTLVESDCLKNGFIVVRFLALEDTEHLENSI